ncbi:hypothetical protein GCM10007304_47030 [Rhodococcoides trifolii]|uniref:Uncharacterized protein n=1 Tax=Rhodococcoides trifolii TaxID=908250 RepID=A0A917G7T4_9NOCA|nr:hypothetical protein [Rhodococcus trifolii]GGG27801.1 hypothetical protein GCM10007304_47030 [Rhodococcus trifolii]
MDRSSFGFTLALTLSPVGVVVVAALVWLATVLVARRSVGVHTAGRRFRTLAGTLGALLVLSGWALGVLAPRWSEPLDTVWWRFAAPLAGATIAASTLALWAVRHPVLVEEPVVPVVRRTWTSFVNGGQLRILLVWAALLLAVTVVCGLASEPGVAGSANITFIGPSGGYGTVYGWTEGLPVILMTIALLGSTWWALHLDAARPFARIAAVDDESRARAAAASLLLTVTIGAVLLSLGAVVEGIGYSAGQVGFQMPGSDPYLWSTGFSSIAPTMRVLGWVLQVAGVVYVLEAIARPFRHRSVSASSEASVAARR